MTAVSQFPESFSGKKERILKELIDQIPKDFNLAIEFRHKSWFSGPMLQDRVIDYLYLNGKSTVITDTPGRRDVLHMSLTQPQVMVRFLGYFLSGFDEGRLRQWLKKIKS